MCLQYGGLYSIGRLGIANNGVDTGLAIGSENETVRFERPYWTEKAEIHAKRQHHARSLVITPNPGGYFRILRDNS